MITQGGNKKPYINNLNKVKTIQNIFSRLLKKKAFVRISGFMVMALLIGVTSIQLLNTLKSIIPSQPALANNCPAGYTWNGTQCEQRTAKEAGTPVCPAGYTDDGQSPPCIRTTAVTTCPSGYYYNTGQGTCVQDNLPRINRCFSGDLPDGSNNCNAQQNIIWNCNSNVSGQTEIWNSATGVRFCTKTPGYFATGSCNIAPTSEYTYGYNGTYVSDLYPSIAWLDNNVYDNADTLDAIMNYDNRTPGGNNQTGPFMSNNFCYNGSTVYSQACPANYRPFLDNGSQYGHGMSITARGTFVQDGGFDPDNGPTGTMSYTYDPLYFLCVRNGLIEGSFLGSANVPIRILHGGISDSSVADRLCTNFGYFSYGSTWDGKNKPGFGFGHNDRTYVCGVNTFGASVPGCPDGQIYYQPGNYCYRTTAPINSCPPGYTYNSGNNTCEERTAKVAGAPVCPSGYTDDGGSPPCVRFTAEIVCGGNQYFNTTSFSCVGIVVMQPGNTNFGDLQFSCDTTEVESATTCRFILQPGFTIIGSDLTMSVGNDNVGRGGACTQSGTNYNATIPVTCTNVPVGKIVGSNIIFVYFGSGAENETTEFATLTSRDLRSDDIGRFIDTGSDFNLVCSPKPTLVSTTNVVCNGDVPIRINPPTYMKVRISNGAIANCVFNIGGNPRVFQCSNVASGTIAGTFNYQMQIESSSTAFLNTSTSTIINGAGTDTDGDGMPDLWEIDNGLNPNNPADANLDNDSDGLTNLQEFINDTNPNNADTDGDGMPDGFEVQYGLNPKVNDANLDLDGDGLSNIQEYNGNGGNNPQTLPNNADTDGDGLNDKRDIDLGFSPVNPNSDSTLTSSVNESGNTFNDGSEDLDGDVLINQAEYIAGTNPLVADTDGDGMPDGWELTYNFNPLNPADAALDLDSDGLSNLTEYNTGTKPDLADTDNDGMPDGWEVQYTLNPLVNDASGDPDNDGLSNLAEYTAGTNPRVADTDGDGMPDGWEVQYTLNPLVNDASGDIDNDGLSNLAEYTAGTNPRVADTDGDGMPDGFEVTNALNPLVNDASGDIDNDGLTNVQEYDLGYTANNPNSDSNLTPNVNESSNALNDGDEDVDGDGLKNKDEYTAGTNPRVADTDGDGMPDGWEVQYGLNPLVNNGVLDGDNDGLKNIDEYTKRFNPTNPNSDSTLTPNVDESANNVLDGNENLSNPVCPSGKYYNTTSLTCVTILPLVPTQIPTITFACPAGVVQNTVTCTFPLPTNTSINAVLLTMGIGSDTTPGGTCTQSGTNYNSIIVVTCTGVPTGNNIGTQPIFAKLGTNPSGNTGETTTISPRDLVNADLPTFGSKTSMICTPNPGSVNTTNIKCTGTLPNYLKPPTVRLGISLSNANSSNTECTFTGQAYVCNNIGSGSVAGTFPFELALKAGQAWSKYPTDVNEIINAAGSDTDGDGMPDGWETINGFNPNDPSDAPLDADGDGLTNLQEYVAGTNPRNADTDGDTMPDGWEVTYLLNPLSAADGDTDKDTDGLKNKDEYTKSTDPTNPDTDNDGLKDGQEAPLGFNPKNPNSDSTLTTTVNESTNNIKDGDEDFDTDELSNKDEYTKGTNPQLADTDGDGMPDGWEVQYGLNPLSAADRDTDPDNDGLSNKHEYDLGFNPSNPNSDSILTPNKDESKNNINDGDEDFDDDGLANKDEYTKGTDPKKPDTDNDGTNDGDEIATETDPLDPNSKPRDPKDIDNDGVPDAVEKTNPNNGDGNNDGTKDYKQKNVVSIKDPNSNKLVIVEASPNCQISGTGYFQELSLGTDTSFEYLNGLVGYTLNCTSSTVKLLWYNTNGSKVYTIRKYGPETPGGTVKSFYDYTASVTKPTINGSVVIQAVFNLTDGQKGDSTIIDGKIVDPVGLAIASTSAPTPTTIANILPRTGGFAIMGVIGLLVIVGTTYMVGRNQKSTKERNR